MGISKANAEKLNWLWQEGHEVDWIEAFIKIADKDSNIIPFKLTKQQKDFVQNMSKYNIILKSRQLGFSLVVCALSIRKCIVTPYSNCLLVSMDQKSTNEIFDKLKIMYDNLPTWLRPDTIANNRQQIKMTNGSKITCVTEGNKDIGRGATNTIVHLSEFAFWKNPKKQLISIQKTLVSGGKIIVESTANALNYFNELYFKAKNSENDFKSFFFNWIDGRELFEKDYKLAVKRWKARNNGKMLTVADLDEEEQELTKLGATLDQLVYRRLEIENDGIDAFHQERPSTDLEAFLNSGVNVFSNKRIDEVEKSILSKKERFIPKQQVINDLPITLKGFYGRSFFIYHLPRQGMRYYIGVDVAEGLKQDYSTISVFDGKGQECAMFRNNEIKPYEFAQILYDVGHLFNKGIIGIEKASGGYSVIEKMISMRYKNLSRYQTFDERNRPQWTIGWDSNSKTKGIAVNTFVEWFETRKMQINSRELLEEMKVFIKHDSGKFAAINGRHDDLVASTYIALELIKAGTYYKY